MELGTIRKISLAAGIVYLLIGILGFVPGVTVMGSGPLPGTGLLLGIFAVNVVHNIAHLIIGAVLGWAGTTDARVIQVNKAMAIVFAVLVVASFLAPIAEGVAVNLPDTGLHLLSMAVTGYLGFVAPRGLAVSRA